MHPKENALPAATGRGADIVIAERIRDIHTKATRQQPFTPNRRQGRAPTTRELRAAREWLRPAILGVWR